MVAGMGLAAGTIGTGRILADEGSRSARTTSSTTQENDRSVEWDGQKGSEHATQDCPDSEGYWHWILTPGGQPSIEDGAMLTVRFDDDSEATVVGYRNGNGDGAVHFDVTKAGGGTVTWAEAEFSGGGENPHLTISDGECQAGETPEDTPTDTPEETATPTPEDTATPTPTPEETVETQEFDDLGVSLECVNGDGTLTVTNSNDEAATVTVTGPDGYSETEEVPAGGSVEFAGLQNGTYNLASHHDEIGFEETSVQIDF